MSAEHQGLAALRLEPLLDQIGPETSSRSHFSNFLSKRATTDFLRVEISSSLNVGISYLIKDLPPV